MRWWRDEADTGRGEAGLSDPRIDFGAGKLAAFAGLGALGHLDLEFAGVDEVLTRHAEAAGGDLLDGGVEGIAIGLRLITGRIFAAFAGVAFTADAIHRDGERLVRLLADGAVGHRTGLEPFHDTLGWLHLIDRDRTAGLELQQTAQRAEVLRLVIDELRVLLEDRVTAGTHRLLQSVDGFGIEKVGFTIIAPLILATHGEHVTVDLPFGVGRVVPCEHLLRDHIKADATDPGGRPREVVVDDILTQANGLENLRPAVALNGGDAHLGHHFDDTLGGGLDDVLAGGLVVHIGQQTVVDHLIDRFEGEVGVDGAAAVADQQREVVHFACLGRFKHHADASAQSFADEIMVEAGDGK